MSNDVCMVCEGFGFVADGHDYAFCSCNTGSPVYWKLYMNDQGEVGPVCMQWFDENDYDKTRFVTDKQFKNEDEAMTYWKDLVQGALRVLDMERR